jgi:acyl-CoA thioester hydrolase
MGRLMTAPASGRIAGGEHRLALRVYYEDTDAAGIVYYANYLRFLERGRTELLRLLGEEHAALREARGVNWTVRRCTLEYLKPARLDDAIEVATRVTELRGASLEMTQSVHRAGEALLTASLTLACMNDAGRPVRLPDHLRASLARVTGAERGGTPL